MSEAFAMTVPAGAVDMVVEALLIRAATLEVEAAAGFTTEYPVQSRLAKANALRRMARHLEDARTDSIRDKML